MSATKALHGRIILVTEDDPLIGLLLVDVLEGEGATVLGPFPSVQIAGTALSSQWPDAALLDVNLTDGDVYPLALRLQESEVPYVLFSATNPAEVPAFLRPRAFLKKPASSRDIVSAIIGMLLHV